MPNTTFNPSTFEATLTVGSKVVARWTNSYRSYQAPATVKKINDKSIVVTLNEAIPTDIGGYPAGHKLPVPSCNSDLWSNSNSVAPVAP